MSDMKSKLPDLKEVGEMTKKLFGDIKTSVEEIIHTYKTKRADSEVKPKAATPKTKAKSSKE